MVSMSTFEVMATLQDPMVAAKFVLFAVTTFVQLSYWCLAGTLVYSQVGRKEGTSCDVFLFLTLSLAVRGGCSGCLCYQRLAYQIHWHTTQHHVHDQEMPETVALCRTTLSPLHAGHLLDSKKVNEVSQGSFFLLVSLSFNRYSSNATELWRCCGNRFKQGKEAQKYCKVLIHRLYKNKAPLTHLSDSTRDINGKAGGKESYEGWQTNPSSLLFTH